MKLYHTPYVLRAIYPTYCWRRKTDHKVLYLTFDDGPTAELTAWLLDTLAQYKAKATFFCVGENVKSLPQQYQAILKAGHSIGNHTYNHLKGWKTSLTQYLENVALCSAYVESSLFRPPYGKITRAQAKALQQQGYRIVMWDVLSYDFLEGLDKQEAMRKIKKYAGRGSILVMHDNLKAEENIHCLLPEVLKHYSEQGYRFEAL